MMSDFDIEASSEVLVIEVPDDKLVYQLMEIFPGICPDYLRKICAGKLSEPEILNDLITEILKQDDYPKRKVTDDPVLNCEEQLEVLKQILPDADPTYLEVHCHRLINEPEQLKIFISDMIEQRTYPTMRSYLRRQQISAQQKQYTTEFNIENFVEVFPDPIAYFEDPDRKGAIVDGNSEDYAMLFFRNLFPRISVRTIRCILYKYSLSFMKTYNKLIETPTSSYMKSKRPKAIMPQIIHNIPLLQEIAFIEHRASIEEYHAFKKKEAEVEKQKAKERGELQTCSCCFDNEVMPKHIYKCDAGCFFCTYCVRKGAEVAYGDGKLDFPCLNSCTSQFSLQTLQAVLDPRMFSKLAMKKQVEEVKAAGLKDLEQCPFCDFVTIPAKDDKVFCCMNPECMKESCRSCKEPSHIPYKCDQVEKEDDVRVRTFIENQMTEALLRKCYKCGLKFIKSEGCNRMTCSCGAQMCYVCNQPVKDYKHFNGPGGDQFNLFLSTGISFRSLAFSTRIAHNTIADSIYQTCDAIWDKFVCRHMPVLTTDMLTGISQEFENIWNFPHCVGAIDGKHIRLKGPKSSGSQFYNYKNYFSIHLQTIADAKYKFITVDIGAYGRQSDSNVLTNSNIFIHLEAGTLPLPPPRQISNTDITLPYVLLGDRGYPLKEYLMRPYPTKIRQKEIFNYRLSRARRTVECTFGILVSKWRCLKTELQLNPAHVDKIVKTVCLLHNIVIDKGGLDEKVVTEFSTYYQELFNGNMRRYNRARQHAYDIRDKFKQYFISGPGSVCFQ